MHHFLSGFDRYQMSQILALEVEEAKENVDKSLRIVPTTEDALNGAAGHRVWNGSGQDPK